MTAGEDDFFTKFLCMWQRHLSHLKLRTSSHSQTFMLKQISQDWRHQCALGCLCAIGTFKRLFTVSSWLQTLSFVSLWKTEPEIHLKPGNPNRGVHTPHVLRNKCLETKHAASEEGSYAISAPRRGGGVFVSSDINRGQELQNPMQTTAS